MRPEAIKMASLWKALVNACVIEACVWVTMLTSRDV